MLPFIPNNHPIILFDSVCNLCNSSVQFIIKHDPSHQFRFAALQGEYGQQLLAANKLPATSYQSFILLENGVLYLQSTGALRVTRKLSAPWPCLYACILIPPFIRNGLYNWIARNRYQWFGKKETCWKPSPELQKIFLP